MYFLIGGASRCCKTTLAAKCRSRVKGQIIAGDGVMKGLKAFTNPGLHPELYGQREKGLVTANDSAQKTLDRIRQRDKEIWRFYLSYLSSVNMVTHDDVLIEGNLWPDFIADLEFPHRAVFMVDTSPHHFDRLVTIRDTSGDRNNWQKEYTDERLQKFAQFNILRSQKTITLCKKFNYPFVDIKDHGLDGSVKLAYKLLMKNN